MNAVAVATRRGRIPAGRAGQFFEQIAAFDFRVAPAPSITDFARVSEMASRLRLTAYDAAYLDLARQLALPLATLNADLRKAVFAVERKRLCRIRIAGPLMRFSVNFDLELTSHRLVLSDASGGV